MSINTLQEPKTYSEANKFKSWNQAMQAELIALERTCTWQLIDAPSNTKLVGCRWVYKVKFHADGSVDRFKVRLLTKGFNQIEGLNYFDT